MNCPRRWRSGGAFQLWSLVVVLVANLFTCDADYTLKTKKQILFNVSTILNPAFARLEGTGLNNSDYVGLIPSILRAMKAKQQNADYRFVKATNNEIGRRKEDGGWTGLMGDVLSSPHKAIGAGPILNNSAYKEDFDLSEPWATVYLTLVVKSSGVTTTLRQALDGGMTIVAVTNSAELEALRLKAATDVELEKLRDKIDNTSRFVASLEDGLEAVRTEANTGVLVNSEEARYYVNRRFCGGGLRSVETTHSIGQFVFVFARNDSTIGNFNHNLKAMADDGSLGRLRDRELGAPGSCNNGDAIRPKNVLAFLLAFATFRSAQIMI